MSNPNLGLKVGSFVWDNLSTESRPSVELAVGQVIVLRRSQQFEVVDKEGHRFRGWAWPLDSPGVALCTLYMEVPRNLARLTGRERQCLELLAQGIETRTIAGQLDMSVSTVHTHMRRAREKLGLRSFEALVSLAARYCYPADQPLGPYPDIDPKNKSPDKSAKKTVGGKKPIGP
jgi:DNA-binding CsgD family transcriptional regulator